MDGAVPAEEDAYELPSLLADDRIGQLPAGSNLLIAGPSRTKKRELALNVLAHGDRKEQPAILVSTDTPADRLIERMAEFVEGDLPPIYVVDCSGGTSVQDVGAAKHVVCVSTPKDLTGIGIGIAKAMQAVGGDATTGLRFAHISLSTLLQYTTEDRVFEFAHVVSGRISAANYFGIWTLNTDNHPETTVNTLRGRFEYVAEIREDDDGAREMRVLGGPDEWRSWTPL